MQPTSSDPKSWYKQQALQIAAQLPAEPEAALEIVAIVEELILFLFVPPELPSGDQAVVRFPGGPSSPSRRASSSGNASVLPK